VKKTCKFLFCRLRIVGEGEKVVGPEETGEIQVVSFSLKLEKRLTLS